MTSCHSARGWRDTCSATPTSVLPPSAAPDTFSRAWGPVSLHRCDECARHSHARPRPCARLDCHSLCPATGAVDAPAWAAGVPRRWHQVLPLTAWYRARWPQRSRWPAGRRCAPPTDSFWCHSCPDPWGWGQSDPPQTRLAQHAIGGLPVPVDPAEGVALLHQYRPEALEDALRTPALEGAMDRAIARKLPRELVPLHPAAHPVDDRIQGRAGINAGAAGPFGRIELREDGRDSGPQVIRRPPDRRQRLPLARRVWHWPPPVRGCSLPIVSPLSRFGIVTWLAKRLEPLSGLAATQENTVCVARLLGGAAALLGEPERARGYYEQALEVAARAGNRPEAALT